MYIEIDKKLLEEVNDVTGFNYKASNGLISYDDVISIIDDLVYSYNRLEEQKDDYERYVKDNYVHRPISNYTGDADDDRF